MSMSVEEFFDHFLDELQENPDLRYYYKYLDNPSRFQYRKAYFCQRLEYIKKHVNNPHQRIWDCGCGFGTTAFFLALNGINVHGTTLEHYIDQIPKRIDFWSQFGDVSGFTYSYENLFDHQFEKHSKDCIIIQDTMHHLEPLDKAIEILNHVLAPGGKMVIIEENGNNIIQNMKLFFQRGNNRIIEVYDETLEKSYLLGNENIRSLKKWKKAFQKIHLEIDKKSIQYIRFYLPFMFSNKNPQRKIRKEQKLWKRNPLLKEYFFFGINFIITKSK